MKVIHPPNEPIIPGDCFTKSEYARHINKSPTWVQKLIDEGQLVVVLINGNELVKNPTLSTSKA